MPALKEKCGFVSMCRLTDVENEFHSVFNRPSGEELCATLLVILTWILIL